MHIHTHLCNMVSCIRSNIEHLPNNKKKRTALELLNLKLDIIISTMIYTSSSIKNDFNRIILF